jgi:transcriptional regulator with XRE-family HTH domain
MQGGTFVFFDILKELCDSKGISTYKAATDIGLNRAVVAKWKTGSVPNGQTLAKLANYFDVTVDYLMTGSNAVSQTAEVSEDDIKVALFGGDEEVTDEDWAQVKNFVDFIKSTKKK